MFQNNKKDLSINQVFNRFSRLSQRSHPFVLKVHPTHRFFARPTFQIAYLEWSSSPVRDDSTFNSNVHAAVSYHSLTLHIHDTEV